MAFGKQAKVDLDDDSDNDVQDDAIDDQIAG